MLHPTTPPSPIALRRTPSCLYCPSGDAPNILTLRSAGTRREGRRSLPERLLRLPFQHNEQLVLEDPPRSVCPQPNLHRVGWVRESGTMQLIPASPRTPVMSYVLHDCIGHARPFCFCVRNGVLQCVGGCLGVLYAFPDGASSLLCRPLLRAGVQLLDTATGQPIPCLYPGALCALTSAPCCAHQIAGENAAELRNSLP